MIFTRQIPNRAASTTAAAIESLEERRLMSVSLSGATNLNTLTGRRTFSDSVNATTNTQDVRKFTISPAGTLTVALTGLTANADVELIKDTNNNQIEDAGEVIASSLKTGTASEAINNKSLAAGTYYLRVFSVSGAVTNYSLSMIVDSAPQTLPTARNVGAIASAKSTFQDFIGAADTNDFYKFTLSATRWLKASLTGLSADANLQIIKDTNNNGVIDSGETLASSSLTGNASESILKSLGAGTYFARVLRNTGDTNYTLSLAAPILNIVFDYRFDTGGFFTSHAAAKDRLEDVARIFGEFTDTLGAITPSGSNTWSEVITNPGAAGGPQAVIANPSVAANTLTVYVGGRSDLGGSELGQGGPGGFNASGTQAWLNTVKARGQAGALATPATDFGPWGGAITFKSTATWNYNASNPTSGQSDFLSVATHEMGHVLGIGTAASWKAKVSGTTFTGANSRTANNGVNPQTDPNGAHWAQGTKSTVGNKQQEVVMDPALTVGTRRAFTRLDFAGLADIGWKVPASNLAAPAGATSLAMSFTSFSTSPIVASTSDSVTDAVLHDAA